MTQSEFFELGLPKWPALLVVGKPVTREQAMEIILRTDDLYFSSNDRPFNRLLNEYFYDIEIMDDSYGGDSKAIAKKLNVAENDYRSIWDYREEKNSEIKSIELLVDESLNFGSLIIKITSEKNVINKIIDKIYTPL